MEQASPTEPRAADSEPFPEELDALDLGFFRQVDRLQD
jgi:hypothetical protein